MKKLISIFTLITICLSLTSCGQDGDAVSPSGASGSTIQEVNADCNGEACL